MSEAKPRKILRWNSPGREYTDDEMLAAMRVAKNRIESQDEAGMEASRLKRLIKRLVLQLDVIRAVARDYRGD